ncbi:DUF362 domain-containing protein [Aeoliella mucimassa]|uniref:DUF362 domain-containing protein n=1 Tax=Aeoliella mucimassa TaxID=2527972 RepID=A0A518AJJ9_9BACT|nr:DUF362 domain-containing protein [Aeoliella mucimassa]QDU54895.1 hypothetical protein Pan181_10800 [Aeoliella mucimassa]
MSESSEHASPHKFDRRTLLTAGIAGAAALAGGPALYHWANPRGQVFVARNQRYDGSLVQTIQDGILATGMQPKALFGKRVLLKPNLVEPQRDRPQMTTHPAMIVAAAEVFRRWGASVSVGEAPGHVRDTEVALIESGVGEALLDGGVDFADLNYQQSAWRPNRGRRSKLRGFWLPESVAEADLVVSMPKMKTHHWVGVTCSMKNFYGVLPGIKYGWPKNVLHHNGIPETVADINASVPKSMAIVDGIECMEGDGPILGTAKQMGLVLIGPRLASVDATAARIMGLDPQKITYLQLATRNMGPLDDSMIDQRGENWQELVSPFQVLDKPHLQRLRIDRVGPEVS